MSSIVSDTPRRHEKQGPIKWNLAFPTAFEHERNDYNRWFRGASDEYCAGHSLNESTLYHFRRFHAHMELAVRRDLHFRPSRVTLPVKLFVLNARETMKSLKT